MERNFKFGERLTEIIYKIRRKNSRINLGGIQDQLGQALGRAGRSAIEHWRKGFVPNQETLEELTQLLIKQGNLSRGEVEVFLNSADYPYIDEFCDRYYIESLTDELDMASSSIQIPSPSYEQLYGREDVITKIMDELHPLSQHNCIVVNGIRGVGKTALAHAIAERCLQKEVFRKVIWLDAGENGTIHPEITMQPGPMWMMIFDAIWYQLVDVDVSDVAAAPITNKRWELQQLLNKTAILLIIDNLGLSPEPQNKLLEELSPLLGRSKVLCLSSCRLGGDVYPIHLKGLDHEGAYKFIRAEAQAKKVDTVRQLKPSELKSIVDTTSGLPLAMKLVVSQLDYLPLKQILHRLKTIEPLHLERSQDAYVQFYQSIYQELWKKLSLNGQELMVTLVLVIPEHGASQATLALLSGKSDEQQLFGGITELWNLSLVERLHHQDNGYFYYLHTLTQQFVVAEIVGWYEQNRQRAANKFLDFFQANLERGLKDILESLSTESIDPSLTDLALHLLSYAMELPELWIDTRNLLIAIAPQVHQSNKKKTWMTLLEKGIESAKIENDLSTEAQCRFYLGRWLYQSDMDLNRAEQMLQGSVRCFQDSGHSQWQAKALNELASVARLQNQFDFGIHYAENAISLLSEVEKERAQSYIYLGHILLDQQKYIEARTWFDKARQLVESQYETTMLANILTCMGVSFRLEKEYDKAASYYEQAIELFEELNLPIHRSVAMMNLGNLYIHQGKLTAALEQYTEAESALLDAHMEFYLTKLYTNQGIAHSRLKHWTIAKELIESSLKRWESIGSQLSVANLIDELGLIYFGQGKWAKSIAKFQQALRHLNNIEPSIARDELSKEIHKHLQDAEAASISKSL